MCTGHHALKARVPLREKLTKRTLSTRNDRLLIQNKKIILSRAVRTKHLIEKFLKKKFRLTTELW